MSTTLSRSPAGLLTSSEQDAGLAAQFGDANSPAGGGEVVELALGTVRGVTALGTQDAVQTVARTLTPGSARRAVLESAGNVQPSATVRRPVRRRRASTGRFIPLQEWEGTVLERRPATILVRLVDKTKHGPEEIAEIPMTEISPRDIPHIRDNSAFYWSIGYHDTPAGQRSRQSLITFRRVPEWTAGELRDIRRRVAEQREQFGWA